MTKKEFVETIKSLQDQSWGIFEALVDQIELDGEQESKIAISADTYDDMITEFAELLDQRFKVKD